MVHRAKKPPDAFAFLQGLYYFCILLTMEILILKIKRKTQWPH